MPNAAEDENIFQFLILGYLIVEGGRRRSWFFQFLILGYVLFDVYVNPQISHFQFLILGYMAAVMAKLIPDIFQFLILGYLQQMSLPCFDTVELSIPHFRIPKGNNV